MDFAFALCDSDRGDMRQFRAKSKLPIENLVQDIAHGGWAADDDRAALFHGDASECVVSGNHRAVDANRYVFLWVLYPDGDSVCDFPTLNPRNPEDQVICLPLEDCRKLDGGRIRFVGGWAHNQLLFLDFWPAEISPATGGPPYRLQQHVSDGGAVYYEYEADNGIA